MAGFSQRIGLDLDTGLRISQVFGGGSRSEGLCGVVAGAHMVFSYMQPVFADDPKKGREELFVLVKEFNQRFRDKYGALHCVPLLEGLDMAVKADREKAKKEKLFSTICTGYVAEAAEIVEEMLSKQSS